MIITTVTKLDSGRGTVRKDFFQKTYSAKRTPGVFLHAYLADSAGNSQLYTEAEVVWRGPKHTTTKVTIEKMANKILALGASSSKQSINKQFASYAAAQIEGAEVNLLDLNNFEMPIYSIDREKEDGIPALAQQFKEHIRTADGIIISFAEHNGAYSAAYKNIYDWVSRIEKGVWLDKPMLLLATSPGGRGGIRVLDLAFGSYSRANKNHVGRFSLPSFRQNFSPEDGILDSDLKAEFHQQLLQFTQAVTK